MNCSNCGHLNEGGKFCVKCGTKLAGDSATVEQQQSATIENQAAHVHTQPVQPEQPTQPVQPVQPAEPNKHVETAKAMSKLYFSYFIQGIKNPTTAAQSVREEQFINGLITMIIYALCVPLTLYFGIKAALSDMFGEFGNELSFSVVLKPIFFSIIILGLIALVTFAVIKLGRVQVTIKDVFARFGTFLIVPTAFILIGFILSLIQVELYTYLLWAGLAGMLFVIPFTIFSFKKDVTFGLDAVYGTLLTYLSIVIIFKVTIDSVLGDLYKYIGFDSSFLNFFN
ncbi:zinc ribbon domain-containing protein [Metabacillus malikii]|uniref:Flp pilus assembly pilin Flp n=1 Tax=Metabacillus malikii TaxID=1504265 RepID=A0ABT9ZAJ9_9BACI|nr:zinc ribbon domain-containing protein [Metabacillus malikii]MDQ0229285.1 Flp pilus assembly pilin Flp [Metabacillus malikii]